MNFISLHNQSNYSILDALPAPKKLLERAKELNQPAIAITDHGTMAATWEAWKASKELNIKLIIGCELYFQDDHKNMEEKLRHIILLAKNAIGYKNLLTINKLGFDQGSLIGKKLYSVVDWNLLEKYSEGLICLTACGNGIISQLLMKNKADEAESSLLKLKSIFKDNLAIEVQPNNMRRNANIYSAAIDQQFLNKRLIDFGKKHDIKVIPACNSHYLNKEDHETHDALLAIGSHQPITSGFRLKYNVPDFYLKSAEEVFKFFSRNYGDDYAREIIDNTVYFSNLCEVPVWIDPKYSNPSGKELPVFPVKDVEDYQEFLSWRDLQNEEVKSLSLDKSYLRYKSLLSFEIKIIQDKIPEDKLQEYKDRIIKEFDVLETLDLSSYMLITADFLNYARKNNISIGPGRGSVGGSYIGYLLNIHQADSIKYDLVFERFHNKLKLAVSDVDNDIAPSGRADVIRYVVRKYGDDSVACVSNFNRNTPKVYIKDIARACELGGSKETAVKIGMDIADCISTDIHSIEDALIKSPLFAENCKKYYQFAKYAKICNKPRAISTHAAGIIIGARPLVGLVPLRKDKDGQLSIEYDKDTAEENGLVKIDFLGLNTLDIITSTLNLIKNNNKAPPKFNYDEYDEKTYNLISEGNVFGVFQLGISAAAVDLCKKIKPKSIYDLSLITALLRPSAKEIRNDFIATRDGKKKVNLLHPSLAGAFKNTFGFPLFDESLLILAKDVAGWDLGEADKLRKLTKEKGKSPQKVKKWREEFIEGSLKNGIKESDAEEIWEKIVVPYGSYAFNASHAVLYSMVSYQTAYLKAHFPVEFLLANLMAETKSNSPDAKTNIEKIKKELKKNNVKVCPPDLNKSQLTYVIQDDKLITGLDGIKFVGDEAIKDIIAKRPFKSFLDFMVRVDSKKVRANNIQALVASGAMDSFNLPRKHMFLYVSDYRKKLQVWLKKHDPNSEEFIFPWTSEPEWQVSELYALERHYMNETFVCRPGLAYKNFFKDQHVLINQVKKAPDKAPIQSMKVILRDFFEFKIKKETSKYYGQSMIKAVIEDRNGEQCSCTIFPKQWKFLQDRLLLINKKIKFEPGLALHFEGTTNSYEDEMGVILENLFNVEPIPALPADLKAKKISLKSKIEESKDLFEEIEDNLYQEGLLDLDDENED